MSAEKLRFTGSVDEGRIMAQTDYIVEGRHFRTKSDYVRALHDKQIIDRLRKETDLTNRQQLDKLKKEIQSGKYRFFTQLEQDFLDEIDKRLENISIKKNKKLDDIVQEELKRQERRRKLIIAACSLAAAGCLGYFGFYFYFSERTNADYERLSKIREVSAASWT